MASQTDTLPAPDTITASRIQWNDLAVLVGPALVDGGGDSYIRLIRLRRDGSSVVATDDEATGSPGGAGPDFTNTWEQNSQAITITIGTNVGVLPGPDSSSGVDSRDASEPYFYTYNADTWDSSGMPEALAAYLADESLAITLTLDDGSAPAAPAFDEDTGDAQTWVVGTAITAITVPTATGNPVPTYAEVGTLPDGIDFDAGTRQITGTPTAAGTGTITIRATNSEGEDDWTVAFSISPAPTLDVDISGPSTVNEDADVTLAATVGGTATGTISYTWEVNSGPGSITGSGASVTYEAPADVASDTDVTVRVTVTRGGLTATDDFELTVSDVVVPTLTVAIVGVGRVREGGDIALTTNVGGTATGDATYAWSIISGPGSIAGSGASVTYEAPTDVLQDTDVVVRVEVTREGQTAVADHPILVTTPIAPSFADSTGNDQAWTTGIAITTVIVPEADGTPVPTYAVLGDLPAGIQFDPATRALTGTPSQIGTGTITISATNEEGSANWMVAYAVSAPAPLPDLSVTIAGQSSVGPDGEIELTAVRGGTLRGSATYLWEIQSGGAGTLANEMTRVATYEAPMTIASQSTVTVQVQITVGSETATADIDITLETTEQETLTVTIRGNSRVIAGDDAALFAEVGGTATGAVTYTWSVLENFGSILGSGLAVLYQSIASTAEDAVAIITLSVERGGITTYTRFPIDVVGVTAQVPAAVPRVGQLPYVGRIRLMGPVSLGHGTALGQARRITEATVGLFRSSGGVIRQAGQRQIGDETPLAVPGINDRLGPEGYQVVTGEVRVPLHDLSTDPTATIQIEQNDPRDLEITYIAVSFDSED